LKIYEGWLSKQIAQVMLSIHYKSTIECSIFFFKEYTQALQKANESLAQWTLSIMSTLISKLLGTK
jgi:hypothetical protein